MTVLPPALASKAYIDRDWFEKEKTLIFRRLWQFFTFYSLVDAPNKFVAKKLFDIPVVVQNLDGELRAFENVCLHRQAPVQAKPYGCRPLACPYHGWSYDADGHVKAIPHGSDYYQLPPEHVAKLCLKKFDVRRVGNLVFINMSEDPIPIERQFSDELRHDLEDLSLHFDREIITTTFRRRFNWKLIFENLRDGIHPSFLHASTLFRDVKFQPKRMPSEILRAYVEGLGKKGSNADPLDEAREFFSRGGVDTPLEHLTPYDWHRHVERYGDKDCYYNWLLFPNLHIASGTGGYSFIIEHYIPQGPAETQADIYCVTARRTKHYEASKAVLYAHLAGARHILDEDFSMLELVQGALHADAPLPNWGAFELRNHRVARWIGDVVDGRAFI